jgi:outer membrane PBP1 activator LpoA protein
MKILPALLAAMFLAGCATSTNKVSAPYLAARQA